MLRRCGIVGALAFAVSAAVFSRGVPAQARSVTTLAIDLEAAGPKVGATIPDFSLPDQHGERRSLKSLLGPKGAVLVFFRSADW